MQRRPLVNRKALVLSIASFVQVSFAPAFAQQTEPMQKSYKAIEKALEIDDFFKAEELLKAIPEKQLNGQPRVLVLRALVAKGLYRLDEAEFLLKTALRKNEKYGDALFELALILMEKKNWKDAEVLLYLAGESENLSKGRKSSLPYYLGVVSFESGNVFDARNSFVRLNWRSALDPALEQSAGAYLSRIARVRPWSVVLPLTYQYESNILGIADGATLPENYSQRSGSKLIAGSFFNLSGLGGMTQGEGPWGLGLRLLASKSIPEQFTALNLVFVEPEANWSKFLGERLGIFKLAAVANWVSLGGKAATSSLLLKSTLFETDLSFGYEADLQKNSLLNRSSVFVRGFREAQLWTSSGWGLTMPVEAGARIPIDKNKPGEYRTDFALTPALSWSPQRRVAFKLSEKLGIERITDTQTSAYLLLKNSPGFTLSFTVQPYLVVSGSFSHEWEKNTGQNVMVKKGLASLSLLGLL